ncbi:nuclear transport factor 2 family protein [Halopseudomonas sp.]|jgi:uncharacterized protein (TIGR02246 family)|uniref:nuclear transport factor 2 family protein n=1 Tax=Halopseudomonas sp. TaxID=2901191 RepID=UPI0039E6AAAB
MSSNNDQSAIEALLDQLDHAHARRDADAIVAVYSPDALIFDLAPPLLHRGMQRNTVAAWLATWDGPVQIEAQDVDLRLDGNLAWLTALNRFTGDQGGKPQDVWFRSTIYFAKTEKQWRIIHHHSSVPFYMDGSYRAAVDLQP